MDKHPPNYRRVECCGTCVHNHWFMVVACWKHGEFVGDSHICDDYEPEGEE